MRDENKKAFKDRRPKHGRNRTRETNVSLHVKSNKIYNLYAASIKKHFMRTKRNIKDKRNEKENSKYASGTYGKNSLNKQHFKRILVGLPIDLAMNR